MYRKRNRVKFLHSGVVRLAMIIKYPVDNMPSQSHEVQSDFVRFRRLAFSTWT